MSKHTKGTWIQAVYSPTDVIADGKTMVAMAREGLNGISREEAIANARLIAAAPDLLDSLRNLVDSFDPGTQFSELAAARAVLSKFLG